MRRRNPLGTLLVIVAAVILVMTFMKHKDTSGSISYDIQKAVKAPAQEAMQELEEKASEKFSEFAESVVKKENDADDKREGTEEAVQGMQLPDSAEEATVKWVSDGDTLTVDKDGTELRVRLIGVDTPESVNPDESKNTLEGKEASKYTKSLLGKGDKVWLEYDVGRNDDYGRTLAYVYFDYKGEFAMLNRLLLQEGMALTMTVPPNVKYADIFTRDQAEARKAGAGFWSTNFF